MYELGYDGALYLKVPLDEFNSFISSGYYKLSVKRYVHDAYQGFIRFKSTLTYIQYQKIIDLLKKKYPLSLTNELQEYINEREIFIETRSKLGIEIKNQENKLFEKYNTYKDVVDNQMARKLREKQMWDSFYMCTMQKSANFSVPGSGKTSALLGMYAYLKAKELVKRIVVVCPKNAFGSWIDEFETCFKGLEELKLFNIHNPIYKNKTDRKRAIMYESGGCNLYLINYESLRSVEEEISQLVQKDTILVFDEVHKVKLVNGEHASSAMKIANVAKYVVAMTGTPIPNGYVDIYNLLHILFNDEYDEFFNFQIPMLRNPSSLEVNQINDKLQPFFCRTTKDQLGVPKANNDLIYNKIATNTENEILDILKKKYKRNKLALLIRILQLESNPKNLLNNLNLSDFKYLLDDSLEIDEIDFVDYSQEIKDLIQKCDKSSKLLNTVETIKQLVSQNKSVVVWCIFIDSIKSISHELEKMGIRTECIYGEVSLEDRQDILTRFKEGDINVLITNPHTLGESVSLHGVCHDALYFEYSYNLVHLLQSKDRIHRLGLPEKQYTQYHYMMTQYQTNDDYWSLNNEIYQRLKDKEQLMLDAIDNHILESMPTTDEDMEMIFNKLKF